VIAPAAAAPVAPAADQPTEELSLVDPDHPGPGTEFQWPRREPDAATPAPDTAPEPAAATPDPAPAAEAARESAADGPTEPLSDPAPAAEAQPDATDAAPEPGQHNGTDDSILRPVERRP
jgi:nicotinate-nucleotide--dimethylbenzimidazole phosphoribosyltransferase